MMILIIDANILIAELLRQRGRELLRNQQLLIYAADKVIEETNYEIQKRIRHMITTGKLSKEAGADLTQAASEPLETRIITVPQIEYGYLEIEAKERIPRDPDDWHTVALTIHLDAAIWTQDNDFLGCGCPCWTTDTLISHLKRMS
ncbi:nucleotide-binding protein, PIN domain-containing protein [Pseudanabaena sp. FACHB-1277]|jgi:predicted nucleic acid-binding protein|uniref:Nucleotide-binding protein, PIN domain-containing protein n=1 Tax=Pseudanabaena cinerea FACHB-1277 TaxID=2949581 RepID=A0A926Z4L6_9CYAN|nr:PIN domain-containing protein [Pseudanabaena cinerea]MBD2149346.1 nucleotide-binding protein, PIN domain-containing protein [Pseudanabaena cinerea FACHB-1277]